jgi:hypothetical protein
MDMGGQLPTPAVTPAHAVLAWLEQLLAREPVFLRRRGFLRGRIILQTARGELLGTFQPAPLLASFAHRAACTIGPAELEIAVSGFFRRTLRLRARGLTLLSLRKPLFGSTYEGGDWEENTWHLRRYGPLWSRRYALLAGDGDAGVEVVRLAEHLFCFSVVLSVGSPVQLPAGVSAGLAMLLYYDRYLMTRFLLLAGAGGGSH